MFIIDWVIVEHPDAVEGGHFRNTFLGWKTLSHRVCQGPRGCLSSDQLPEARGQGESQRGLGLQADLESKWDRKLLTREKPWQGRPLDLLFQANKSKTEQLPPPSCPRDWGWGQLEEEPRERTYCEGGGGHGSWGPTGVCILHASGSAPAFISHFLIFRNITVSLLG